MNTGRKVESVCEYFQIISIYSVRDNCDWSCRAHIARPVRKVLRNCLNSVSALKNFSKALAEEARSARNVLMRIPFLQGEYEGHTRVRAFVGNRGERAIACHDCPYAVWFAPFERPLSRPLAEYCKEELVNAWDADANADDFGAADALPLRHCAREPRRYDKHPHIVPTLGNLFERQLRSANIGQIGSGIN